MSAISPQNLTYQNRSVYLTPSEVKSSAIAAAVDFSQLVPGGDLKAQDVALLDLIKQASAEADQHCLGAVGTLGATINTETGRYRSNRQGQIIVHPAFWPILEVQTFAVGTAPGATTPLTVTNANCWIEQRQFVMTATADSWSSAGPVDLSALGYRTGNLQFVQYSYVNGYFNQPLASQAAAGATSVTVPSITGLYANSGFTIYDGAISETCIVSPAWNGTSTTIPLVSALAYSHGVGTIASALPPTVKEAVIHLVVAKVKARGQGGFVLNEIGEPAMVTTRSETSMEDHRVGLALLDAFKQITGRA